MVIIPSNLNPNSNAAGGTFGAFKPPAAARNKTLLYVLLGILIIAVLIVGYYYASIFGFVTVQAPPQIPPAQELNVTEIRVSSLSNLNFNAINLDIYKALRLHGAIPIKVEALGRDNPFAAF